MAQTQPEKLRRIEEAALRLFASRGVAAASVADIATAAGVSQGYLYRHWKDKEEMALRLFEKRYVASRVRLEAAVAGAGTTRGRIGAMIEEGCRLHDEDPDGFRFLMLTQHQHLGKAAVTGGTLVDVVRGVIEQGIGKGEIGLTDAEVATAVTLGVFLQTALSELYGDLRRPLSEVSGMLAAACWRAIDGRP